MRSPVSAVGAVLVAGSVVRRSTTAAATEATTVGVDGGGVGAPMTEIVVAGNAGDGWDGGGDGVAECVCGTGDEEIMLLILWSVERLVVVVVAVVVGVVDAVVAVVAVVVAMLVIDAGCCECGWDNRLTELSPNGCVSVDLVGVDKKKCWRRGGWRNGYCRRWCWIVGLWCGVGGSSHDGGWRLVVVDKVKVRVVEERRYSSDVKKNALPLTVRRSAWETLLAASRPCFR